MGEKQDLFIAKLQEIFQINNGLDFGIYRIMNEKKSDIENYINNTLPNKINEFLQDIEIVSVDNTEAIKKLEGEISVFEKLGNNEDALKQIEINRKKITQLQQSSLSGNTEEEIYDKLLTFLSRYYDEGDFISQRRYKDGVYAVPYSGEEVKLHWANHDQYYIKTGENFKDYIFNIEDDFNVKFVLTDAEIERDNNKSNNKKVYVLAEPTEEYENAVYVLENEEKTRAELVIRLSYKYDKDIKQNESTDIILDSVKQLENNNEISSHIKSKIVNIFKPRNEKDKDKTSHIEYHLKKYIAKNSFDFFIHKDLKKFLIQELDFYIKNEVIYLQDLYGSVNNSDNLVMNVKKASVIQNIGSEIITFLAQLEDFQKELYLKKKFVTETNYCITLDKIDEKYYDEIIANKAQIEEWKKLFAIDEIKGDLHTKEYSDPLSKEFLKENEYLVLDTAFFSEEFKEKIIADIENLDDNINGVLIHGDNFQALNLMQEKYKEQVQCVYIDPPYNTENRDFNYKDNFKHSSWLAMMNDRLDKTKSLMNDTGVLFSSIDDNEVSNLKKLGDKIFGGKNFIAHIPRLTSSQRPAQEKTVSKVHDYIVCYGKTINVKFNHVIKRNMKNVQKDEIGYYIPNDTSPILASTTQGYSASGDYDFIYNGKTYKPQDSNGYRRRWLWSRERMEVAAKLGILVETSTSIRVQNYIDKEFEVGTNLMIDKAQDLILCSNDFMNNKYTNKKGSDLVKQFLCKFDFPKPKELLEKIIDLNININSNDTILDYFAGSGTTGHAVIDLNREDNGNRKYILVEMGEYFDTVTKPRIEKVIYSKDWKDGKPVSRKGSSHIFKYIRLESYEDTLNNVEFSKGFNIDDYLQSEYLTKYKIQKEAENSKIYLPAEVFYNPFEFHLKITRKNESMVQKIDLIETFNFLIGLQVNNIYTKKYNAEFKTMELGRLQADIKPDNNGQYIFKIVEGSNLKGEKVLVIWRNIIGDIRNNDEINKNNAVLESVTLKNQIKPADSEYDILYINCTNSLQHFAKDGGYKVALIEEIMKDKMFNGI